MHWPIIKVNKNGRLVQCTVLCSFGLFVIIIIPNCYCVPWIFFNDLKRECKEVQIHWIYEQFLGKKICSRSKSRLALGHFRTSDRRRCHCRNFWFEIFPIRNSDFSGFWLGANTSGPKAISKQKFDQLWFSKKNCS